VNFLRATIYDLYQLDKVYVYSKVQQNAIVISKGIFGKVQMWYPKEYHNLNTEDICRDIQYFLWFCGWDGSVSRLQRTLRYFDLRQQDMIVRPKKYRTSKLEMAGLVWDHSIKSVLITNVLKKIRYSGGTRRKNHIYIAMSPIKMPSSTNFLC